MARIDKTMARHLAKSKRSRSRLNMQIPPELLSWAKDYVKRKGTTVTQLFVGHLRELQSQDVPQI